MATINVYDIIPGNQFITLKNGPQKILPRDSWAPHEVDSFAIKGCTKSAKSLVIHYFLRGALVTGETKRMIFAKDCCSDEYGRVHVKINGRYYPVGRWEIS